jgi:hypothetical protein
MLRGAVVLIVGAFCLLWGLVIIFFLPNAIASTRFFSRDERLFLIARLRKNQTGIDTGHGVRWDQVRVASLWLAVNLNGALIDI